MGSGIPRHAVTAAPKAYVSHPRYITLTTHDGRFPTPIPQEVAEQLLRHLLAERITQRLIRRLSPDSVYCSASPQYNLTPSHYVPEKLPRAEIVPGLKTQSVPPVNPAMPHVCFLPRFREVFGDLQISQSLPSSIPETHDSSSTEDLS